MILAPTNKNTTFCRMGNYHQHKINCVPLLRSIFGVLVIGGVCVVGDSPAVDDLPIVVDVPVVEALPYSCCVPIIDGVSAVSGRCAVAGVSAAAGASPVSVIPTAGSVVDPYLFQCVSGSSMLDHSHPALVPELGPAPGLHERRPSYERSLHLSK
jgi:hypothetical protein